MSQFIVDFPDQETQDQILNMAHQQKVHTKWIIVDPNTEYLHEFQFAEEAIWYSLSEAITITINDEPEGQAKWPTLPFKEWPVQDRRTLITLAVTRWNYLGPNGADSESVIRDYRQGMIPYSDIQALSIHPA